MAGLAGSVKGGSAIGVAVRPSVRYDADMTSKDDDRAARLAAALRDNLRRRKAQARSLPPAAAPVTPDPDAP